MNYKFKLALRPNDIFAMMTPDQRDRFSSIEIYGAELINEVLYIQCQASEEKTVDTMRLYSLPDKNNVNMANPQR